MKRVDYEKHAPLQKIISQDCTISTLLVHWKSSKKLKPIINRVDYIPKGKKLNC